MTRSWRRSASSSGERPAFLSSTNSAGDRAHASRVIARTRRSIGLAGARGASYADRMKRLIPVAAALVGVALSASACAPRVYVPGPPRAVYVAPPPPAVYVAPPRPVYVAPAPPPVYVAPPPAPSVYVAPPPAPSVYVAPPRPAPVYVAPAPVRPRPPVVVTPPAPGVRVIVR
jgi:hypothetical protein